MKTFTALGLMSGTATDGLDAAIIQSNGENYIKPMESAYYEFPETLRKALLACQGQESKNSQVKKTEKIYSQFITQKTQTFLNAMNTAPDYIGWHGQTIAHAPHKRLTLQLGDAPYLAAAVQLPVVYDFRSADIRSGGQGAPLTPIYHSAIAKQTKLPTPALFVNIGGIANITYCNQNQIIAFDSGPGNAPMDDITRKETTQNYDKNGNIAKTGHINSELLQKWLNLPYFAQNYPKSLHREDFHSILADLKSSMPTADKLATLAELTAMSIAKACALLPQKPKTLILCGGGRHNSRLTKRIENLCQIKNTPIETIGFNADMIEAQAFAYLAIRHVRNLPLSFPTTTGTPKPLCGGRLALP